MPQTLYKALPAIALLVCLLPAGCSKSDDQREFENQALIAPQGITETDASGKAVEGGSTDPDDWQISPMYAGLIRIETPAHPNPIPYNSSAYINLYITSLDVLNHIEVFFFKIPGDINGRIDVISDPSPGLNTLTLNGQIIAGDNPASAPYRILIYDGRQNLISYGDVRVE